MLKLHPYRAVGELAFGDSPERADEFFGRCLFEKKNRQGELEKHYKEFTLCFTARSFLFRECTVHRGVAVTIGGRVVDWSLAGLLSLCREDGAPMKYHGSVILFTLGISLAGLEAGAESDRSLAIFAKGDWDTLRKDMKPFDYDKAEVKEN